MVCYCVFPMLYTRKGDKGTTKTLRDEKRISKNSAIAEALGTVDELNSFLGLCKVKTNSDVVVVKDEKITLDSVIEETQQNLFTIQAELAGAGKKVKEEKVDEIEIIINEIEKQLPPIKSFLVSGGTELGAMFDVARAIARRAERRVVGIHENEYKISEHTLAYINRLSSLLYALARHSNYKSGINEPSPKYE